MKKEISIMLVLLIFLSISNTIAKPIDNKEIENDSILHCLKTNMSNDITWTKHIIEDDINHASGIYVCDIDNDLDNDVFACAAVDNELAYWLNNGEIPCEWTKHSIDDSFIYPMDIHVVDIDKDNDMDVLGAAWGGGLALWVNNGGNPISWKKQQIKTNYIGGHEVFACDIDGDDDIDILGASAEANSISLWSNDGGNPIQWTEITIAQQYAGARSVFSVDIDNDNDMDVLGAALLDNEITVWYNEQGNPIQWTEQVITNEFPWAHHVYAADVDSDGDMDVLGAAYDNEVSWWKNEGGSPINWNKQVIDNEFDSAMMVIVEDLDLDGKNDIIATSSKGNSVCWWKNDGANPINWNKFTIDDMCAKAWPIFTSDIDNDGDMDVIGGSESNGGIMWYENSLYPIESDLDVQGSLIWSNVKPKSTVTGSFSVFNKGISYSSLNWEVAEKPNWGIWTINPDNGDNLTPEMGMITVEVNVEVPEDKNQEFTGDLKIINKDYSEDFCIINVSLATGKNQKPYLNKYPMFFDQYFRKNNLIEFILIFMENIESIHNGVV